MSIDSSEKESWLRMADDFCNQGEFQKMRACGREILDMDKNDGDGLAVVAEASLYLLAAGDDEALETAEAMLLRLKEIDPKNPRGLLAKAEYYWSQFMLDKAIPAFSKAIDSLSKKLDGSTDLLLERAHSFYADACVLAGNPTKAANSAFAASHVASDLDKKAIYYSKGLFLNNYRRMSVDVSLKLHQQYNKMLPARMKFPHSVEKRMAKHSLRIGYISPDFRNHAAAYFFTAFFKYANNTDFKVYAYSTCKPDAITGKFRQMVRNWRDMQGKTPQQIAHQIFDDHIDILIDLSGHTQNSCLPVLAYRPAPVQMSAIGYINTTGLDEVDYFLSDEVCLPAIDRGTGFSEETLRLPHCHLCYSPGIIRSVRPSDKGAPVERNGYITFGSFNNFNKVTEDILLNWRNILEQVPNSKLVIKAKICSIPSGQEIVLKRLREVAIDISRVELRPFSQDYLQQYEDIDIALDTSPYTGGLTTCDAIYMGVPVITRLGRTHKSRYSASILVSAGLKDFIARNDSEYVNKAVHLAKNRELLNILHMDLPVMVRQSRLMDGRAYMQDLEEAYRGIWAKYLKG